MYNEPLKEKDKIILGLIMKSSPYHLSQIFFLKKLDRYSFINKSLLDNSVSQARMQTSK
jgi:hypothetical protein